MRRLILASTSPYRRALLERLGVPFSVVAPRCDEEVWRAEVADPFELAVTLARVKAESVASAHPGAVVIGCDQVCALDGEVLGKPGDRVRALAQLRRLAGRTHSLITAVNVQAHDVQADDEPRPFHDVSTLRMRALGEADLARYLDRDQPWDCAGSYKLEGAGIALFASIRSDDHTAIVGLPLLQLTGVLRALGYSIP
jgi:septum formation protein